MCVQLKVLYPLFVVGQYFQHIYRTSTCNGSENCACQCVIPLVVILSCRLSHLNVTCTPSIKYYMCETDCIHLV